jgi:prepilin-type N-terminal cleavage/methylation domain-containing protein
MTSERGFSLIELLIVVVIIGVIMALAVPGLVRARQYAQAGSAIQSLRTITTAENLYERRFHVFGLLTDLAPEGSLDSNLAAGHKSGYLFDLQLTPDPGTGIVDKKHFSCTASPVLDAPTAAYFYVDETAVIRSNTGAPADGTSTPIPQ